MTTLDILAAVQLLCVVVFGLYKFSKIKDKARFFHELMSFLKVMTILLFFGATGISAAHLLMRIL